MQEIFRRTAHKSSELMGSSWAFVLAVLVIAAWAISGPLFDFSNTWQLMINTGTTVLTFLMVFLIQNTQNRDAHAIHLKLDELIRSSGAARNSLIDIEKVSDEDLEKLEKEFKSLRAHYEQHTAALARERERRRAK